MKKISKLLTLCLTAAILLSSIVFSVSAAGSTISFSNKNPEVGSNVTVTVRVNGDAKMTAVSFSLAYNPSVLSFQSASETSNGGAGLIEIVGAAGNEKSKSYSIVFKAIAAGQSNIQVSNGLYVADDETPFNGSSATLTVKDKAKSDNANLSKLSLSKGTLSPRFSASKTSYTATVDKTVTECRVYATAADEANGAKVTISGENALKIGKNTRTVTVTAASGKQKTYTIVITRTEEEPTESDTTSEVTPPTTEEPTVADPYAVELDGATYKLATDLSSVKLPNGFFATTAEHNETAVAVAEDDGNNYRIYYLTDALGTTCEPYLLENDGTSFTKLKYATFADNTYIFADVPTNMSAPEGYFETDIEIGNFKVKAFASNENDETDFYYVYCFFKNGFRTYRYDSRENVLQRSPDFKLAEKSITDINPGASFGERFSSLTTNAKIIVIGLALAVIGAIALIILLIIKLIKGRNDIALEDEDEMMFLPDFDETSVTDANAPENNTQDK